MKCVKIVVIANSMQTNSHLGVYYAWGVDVVFKRGLRSFFWKQFTMKQV